MLIGLKILHLLALVFGSIASLGNIYLGFANGPHDLASPGYTNTLRKFYRLTGLGAITVLWATGLLLMVGKYGFWVPGFAFTAKIAFVVIITAIVLFINLKSPGWSRSGGPPSYIPGLSWVGFISLLLVVIFAVIRFG